MSKPTEREQVTGHNGDGEAARPKFQCDMAFVHAIRVRWGHCDPAKIAYTGHIPGFALEAIEAWWEARTGEDWFTLNVDRNLGTPFVHMQLDFRAPITPRHMLECEVRLKRLGARSITHTVRASQAGVLCFEGEFVAAFVEADAMTSCRPPDDIVSCLGRVDPQT